MPAFNYHGGAAWSIRRASISLFAILILGFGVPIAGAEVSQVNNNAAERFARYERKYVDEFGDEIMNYIEISKATAKSIQFSLLTVSHGNVCDVDGTGILSSSKNKGGSTTYKYFKDQCVLSIVLSGHENMISTIGEGGKCQPLFCGHSGKLDGDFNLRK